MRTAWRGKRADRLLTEDKPPPTMKPWASPVAVGLSGRASHTPGCIALLKTNFGSSVERTAKLHPLCKRGRGSSGLFRARSGRRAAGGESDEGATCSQETACVASRPSSRQQPGATAAWAVDRILLRRLLDGAFGAWSGRRTSTLQRLAVSTRQLLAPPRDDAGEPDEGNRPLQVRPA